MKNPKTIITDNRDAWFAKHYSGDLDLSDPMLDVKDTNELLPATSHSNGMKTTYLHKTTLKGIPLTVTYKAPSGRSFTADEIDIVRAEGPKGEEVSLSIVDQITLQNGLMAKHWKRRNDNGKLDRAEKPEIKPDPEIWLKIIDRMLNDPEGTFEFSREYLEGVRDEVESRGRITRKQTAAILEVRRSTQF